MNTLLKIFFALSLFTSACNQNSNKVRNRKLTREILPADRNLISLWKEFSVKFNSLDTAFVRKVSLDSIWLFGDHLSSSEFINRYQSDYLSSPFSNILDTNKISICSIGCHPGPDVKDAVKQPYNNAFNCQQITISKDTVGSIVNGIEFTFLETTKGYRLFGINNSSYFWRIDGIVDTSTKE